MGSINIQFAVKDSIVYVIEANPRASRTVPFVSKATGVPLAKISARVMAGESLDDLHLPSDRRDYDHFSVKEAVMPFGRFPGADTVLGPEMKSTGEVMGIAPHFPEAFAKTQKAIDYDLPASGTVFLSVCDPDKRSIVSIARDFKRLGFDLAATKGTAKTLAASGVDVRIVKKVSEVAPGEDSVIDLVASGEVVLLVNTPMGRSTRSDGYELRKAAVSHGVAQITSLAGAQAMVAGIEAARMRGLAPIALQDLDQWDI